MGQVPDETNSTAGDDPITPDEVLAPAVDWQDAEWGPLLPFEDPATVDCDGREECMEALQDA